MFGGDGRLILLKFQIGGWRAAYVHFVVTALIAVAVSAVMLLVGRLFFWRVDRFSEKPGQSSSGSNLTEESRERSRPVRV
jgi:Kef-type K+ transport system membrane component KefB